GQREGLHHFPLDHLDPIFLVPQFFLLPRMDQMLRHLVPHLLLMVFLETLS
ncbi:hypothetical protein A2U01_0014666, partial [Trifolium medium]|nr:hypothetical protein [Trifolium medium]